MSNIRNVYEKGNRASLNKSFHHILSFYNEFISLKDMIDSLYRIGQKLCGTKKGSLPISFNNT